MLAECYEFETEKEIGQMEEITERRSQTIVKNTVKTGVSFGSALAMVISYCTWHSIGWAIVHGILSWVYVIYYLIRY